MYGLSDAAGTAAADSDGLSQATDTDLTHAHRAVKCSASTSELFMYNLICGS